MSDISDPLGFDSFSKMKVPKMKSNLLKTLVLSTLVLPVMALATPLNGSTIDNLNIDGGLYDVTFVDGSYDSVFSSVAPTFLGSSSLADDALNAIVNSPEFAALTSAYSGVIVPYASGFTAWVGGGSIALSSYTGDPSLDYSTEANYTFAEFSAVVPEPDMLSLVGVALAGLALLRGRKKSTS